MLAVQTHQQLGREVTTLTRGYWMLFLSQWAILEGTSKRPREQGKPDTPHCCYEDAVAAHSSWPSTPLSGTSPRPVNDLGAWQL